MSDFDFDELDKAVNGALASVSTDTDDVATPKPEAPEATPQQDAPTPAETSPVVAPAARRSSGRFMDMVHPSSDMRTDMRTRQSPAVVTPLETSSADQASSTPNSDLTPVPAEAPQTDTTDWQAPLESPFLPDAKVEKRPLGGSEPTGDLTALPADKDESAVLDAHTMPDPLDFMVGKQQEQAIPEEEPAITLEEAPKEDTPALVEAPAALDLNELDKSNTETPAESVEQPSTTTGPEITSETHIEPLPTTEEKVESPDQIENHIAALEEQPVGPTSITQQYQEQPSSTQTSGAIYDTEAYHQPLAHPEKKRSSWWIVLWIFLLIVFGAGAGAAFYIYVLPTL